MDKQRYAAIKAEAFRRIAARKRAANASDADRQAETVAPDESAWIRFASVDELFEAILAASDEDDHGQRCPDRE